MLKVTENYIKDIDDRGEYTARVILDFNWDAEDIMDAQQYWSQLLGEFREFFEHLDFHNFCGNLNCEFHEPKMKG